MPVALKDLTSFYAVFWGTDSANRAASISDDRRAIVSAMSWPSAAQDMVLAT
jgi:hypothetical protein